MIIDFRVQPPYKSFLGIHFFRPRPAMEDPVTGNPFAVGRITPPSFEQQSIELFVQEMDEAGIDLAVITGQRTGPTGRSASNDDIAELVRRYPGRFAGFGGIHPLEPGALEEVRRCVERLGCHGIAMLPGWSDPPLHDDAEAVYPIYETCGDLGVPVVITSSHYIGPDMTYSLPIHIQKVAFDFPELTIIIGHAAWPWTLQVCAVAMRCSNVYLMPEFYMYIPDMPGAEDYVKAANSYLSYRMLYSSCYPSRSLGQALTEFKALPLKPEAQANMLGRNGARLLGLGG
jgi:predicted TIM-barrel fold metal-dependent hydrolase